MDAYSDLDTFRLYLRNAAVSDEADDPDSALEALALEAASRAIDRATLHPPGSFNPAGAPASARYYTVDGRKHYGLGWIGQSYYPGYMKRATVTIGDLFTMTDLAVAFDTAGDRTFATAETDFYVAPSNAASEGRPWTLIVFGANVYPPTTHEGIRVTAQWGWTATPPTIENATLLQASRFLKRRDSPFGVAGSPELGNELRLFSQVDADVRVMVREYRRTYGAV